MNAQLTPTMMCFKTSLSSESGSAQVTVGGRSAIGSVCFAVAQKVTDIWTMPCSLKVALSGSLSVFFLQDKLSLCR